MSNDNRPKDYPKVSMQIEIKMSDKKFYKPLIDYLYAHDYWPEFEVETIMRDNYTAVIINLYPRYDEMIYIHKILMDIHAELEQN
jgi:hypothetical protein